MSMAKRAAAAARGLELAAKNNGKLILSTDAQYLLMFNAQSNTFNVLTG